MLVYLIDYGFSEDSLSDPSWTEVQYFINLLNEQLTCSEESVFCQEFDGLKAFVVKFMIIMSKVYTRHTHSTNDTDDVHGCY